MQPSWRLALVIWIAIYPTITVLQLAVGPWLRQLPLPVATLVTTGVLVPLMVFILIPNLMRVLGPRLGLTPPAGAPER